MKQKTKEKKCCDICRGTAFGTLEVCINGECDCHKEMIIEKECEELYHLCTATPQKPCFCKCHLK